MLVLSDRILNLISHSEPLPIDSYEFYTDRNFILCLLWRTGFARPISFGVAKRNPNEDDFSEERGETIAYSRAVLKLIKVAAPITVSFKEAEKQTRRI